MAIELDARPTIILKITRMTLPIIPFILASVIPRLRAALFSCKIILNYTSYIQFTKLQIEAYRFIYIPIIAYRLSFVIIFFEKFL